MQKVKNRNNHVRTPHKTHTTHHTRHTYFTTFAVTSNFNLQSSLKPVGYSFFRSKKQKHGFLTSPVKISVSESERLGTAAHGQIEIYFEYHLHVEF